MVESCSALFAWLARSEYANVALTFLFLFGAAWVVLKKELERVP
jgi:hypothetical protein